jgi:hypothetical protein
LFRYFFPEKKKRTSSQKNGQPSMTGCGSNMAIIEQKIWETSQSFFFVFLDSNQFPE